MSITSHFPDANGHCRNAVAASAIVMSKDCAECRKNEIALSLCMAFREEFTFLLGLEADLESWLKAGRGIMDKLGISIKTRRVLVTERVQFNITMNTMQLPVTPERKGS